MKLPPLSRLRQDDTHRLVLRKYVVDELGPLSRLADDDRELGLLGELERSTDSQVLGEAGELPGIGVHELVFGVPYAHIVNAAYTYARTTGSRFNGPERGAWYAAFQLSTSQAEIAFHRGQELREIAWPHPEEFEYLEFLADFRADFHDIRKRREFRDCLAPDSYAGSQKLAYALLEQGSVGVVYPSAREQVHGDCIACFRPALVNNVRRGIAMTVRFESYSSEPTFALNR